MCKDAIKQKTHKVCKLCIKNYSSLEGLRSAKVQPSSILGGVYGDKLVPIGTGEEVRKLFKTNPEFKEAALPYVERGELVPDNLILPIGFELLETALADPDQKLHGLDGFPRNAAQLNAILRKKYISPDDTQAVILNARPETCWRRMLHRFENKPNGERPDESNREKMIHAFKQKMYVYDSEIPVLKRRLHREGFRIHMIDANREISVFTTDVLAIAKSIWNPFPSPTPTTMGVGNLSPREHLALVYRKRQETTVTVSA